MNDLLRRLQVFLSKVEFDDITLTIEADQLNTDVSAALNSALLERCLDALLQALPYLEGRLPGGALTTEDHEAFLSLIEALESAIGSGELVGGEIDTDAISDFCLAWEGLEESGACDSIGGLEFSRILVDWLKSSQTENLEEFIRSRANAGPSDLRGEL